MCKGGETEKSGEKVSDLSTFPPLFKYFSRFHHIYTLSLYVVGVTREEAEDIDTWEGPSISGWISQPSYPTGNAR